MSNARIAFKKWNSNYWSLGYRRGKHRQSCLPISSNDIKTNITTGKTLATQLQVKPQLFPSEVANLIQAGESSGNLSGTLIYLANMYNEDIRDWTKNLTTVLEPVLMLIMGLAVGFIAISIITPIYGITQNLHP